MTNLTKLPLLEQYITENGTQSKFSVPFFKRKNQHNVELQNWSKYQDLRKGIITIRQSGIRVKSPDYYPCLTYNPGSLPIIYDNGYRYLNQPELLALQSFPASYQFPANYSLTKIASLLGNSVNVQAVKHFIKQQEISQVTSFVDLFAGIGGFHLALKDYARCVLAVDINKNSSKTYQLNFPATLFLLGNINDKGIQKQIILQEFDLLCAGFPCQPFSRAGKKSETSPELTSLLAIIKKKQPNYLLLESVLPFLKSRQVNELLSQLITNYQLSLAVINPKDLGVKQNRPRLFVWGSKKEKLRKKESTICKLSC